MSFRFNVGVVKSTMTLLRCSTKCLQDYKRLDIFDSYDQWVCKGTFYGEAFGMVRRFPEKSDCVGSFCYFLFFFFCQNFVTFSVFTNLGAFSFGA